CPPSRSVTRTRRSNSCRWSTTRCARPRPPGGGREGGGGPWIAPRRSIQGLAERHRFVAQRAAPGGDRHRRGGPRLGGGRLGRPESTTFALRNCLDPVTDQERPMTAPFSRREFLATGFAAAVPFARGAEPRPAGADVHRQLLALAAEQERKRREKFAAVKSATDLGAVQEELRQEDLARVGGRP